MGTIKCESLLVGFDVSHVELFGANIELHLHLCDLDTEMTQVVQSLPYEGQGSMYSILSITLLLACW